MSKIPKTSILATEPGLESSCLNVGAMVTWDHNITESVRLEKISRVIKSTGASQLQRCIVCNSPVCPWVFCPLCLTCADGSGTPGVSNGPRHPGEEYLEFCRVLTGTADIHLGIAIWCWCPSLQLVKWKTCLCQATHYWPDKISRSRKKTQKPKTQTQGMLITDLLSSDKKI